MSVNFDVISSLETSVLLFSQTFNTSKYIGFLRILPAQATMPRIWILAAHHSVPFGRDHRPISVFGSYWYETAHFDNLLVFITLNLI